MNLYGLLDAIINKVNRAVKVEQQELDSSLQKQARENINVPSKNEVCNPNLLDNWYFGNPVNQRGQTNYNALGYTIDRWTAAYGDISVLLESDGLQLVSNGSNALIEQYLEEDLTGKTVCFSVLTDIGLFSETKVVDDLGYISPGVISNIGNLEIFVSGGRTIFRIWLKTIGASLKLIAAKLEFGETQTLARQDSNGNWVLNEIPKYSEELLKCRQYDPYTGEYIGLKKFVEPEQLCNPNLLDNWYFGNPVNQQNITSWSTGYGIDKWRVSTGATARVLSDSLSFSGSAQYQNLEQSIDNFTNLLGKTVTLSVLFKETVPDITFTTGFLFGSSFYQEFVSGDLYSVTYTIPLDANLMVIFVQDTIGGQSCNISAIKLELGDTQTLAHQDSNGNWVLNEIPKYSEELLKCRQYDPYTGEYVGLRKFGQPRNLLDNSDFRNPINQRGFSSGSSVTAGQYFIDRWKAYNDINSVTLNTNGFSVSIGGKGIGQHIEGLEYLVGKKVTIAIKYSDGYLSVASGTVTNNDTWTELAQANGANGSYIKLVSYYQGCWFFLIFPDVTKIVQWVALYEGEYTADTLPEYQPKGYAAELAECQRYFQSIQLWGNYAIPITTGIRVSDAYARVPLVFAQTFRATPTMTIDSSITFRIAQNGTTKTIANSDLSIMLALKNRVILNIAVSGLVSGYPVTLYGTGTEGNQYIYFSADL